MKILQINSVCGKGSTGKIAVQISDYLNEKGIENYIAYGYNKTDRPNTYFFGNMMEAHLHSFISRKLCMQGYGSYFVTKRLISYIKKLKPNIVHLHNIHGHYLNFKLLFKYLNSTDIKVVWTFHDCWPFTGKCVHFTEAGCYKWKSQCEHCPQLEFYPDSTHDRTYKNYIDKKKYFTENKNLHIVTVSNWLKETTQQSFFKGKDIRCIYNGIDTDVFKYVSSDIREKYNIKNKKLILGVASIWNTRKRPDLFAEIAKRMPDTAVVMIGKHMSEIPPSDNLILLNNIESSKELVEWYSTADVFINFSKEETFGLVAVEAMACGTPALVMNSTACPEAVDKSYVLPDANIDHVETFINKIISRDKDIVYNRNFITEHFSIAKMQNEYFNLYMELNNSDEA